MLTITRWVFDGLRLVSLAQAACESRGCAAADHIAIVQQDRVATFLLKKTPFTQDVAQLRATSAGLGFTSRCSGQTDATKRLREAHPRQRSTGVYDAYLTMSRPRPTIARFFHTTKDQGSVS